MSLLAASALQVGATTAVMWGNKNPEQESNRLVRVSQRMLDKLSVRVASAREARERAKAAKTLIRKKDGSNPLDASPEAAEEQNKIPSASSEDSAASKARSPLPVVLLRL